MRSLHRGGNKVPWKLRPLEPIEQENDALKTTIVYLRRELENKQGTVGRLKLVLRERLTRIDQLTETSTGCGCKTGA